MSELHDLLDQRAERLEPSAVALERVWAKARRRRARRRALAGGTALMVAAGSAVGVAALVRSGSGRLSPPEAIRSTITRPKQSAAIDPLFAPAQAVALRKDLGIEGRTKGAAPGVIVRSRTKAQKVIQVGTGLSLTLPADTEGASLSPDGAVVVAVQDNQIVIIDAKTGLRTSRVGSGHRGTGAISWQRGGGALFGLVNGGWVRIDAPDAASRPVVHPISVPKVPGGPALLSVSPEEDFALLFGVTSSLSGPRSHLYLGRFDGSAVTAVTRVVLPSGALRGPVGWVGDNAFLVASGPGEALIVKTDGSRVTTSPAGIPNPCTLVEASGPCRQDGPWLLGTNGQGALLFWRVAAEPSARGAARGDLLVLYYKTWLNGTHAARLTGTAGIYGPPVAAR
jgi:hypothetical protein